MRKFVEDQLLTMSVGDELLFKTPSRSYIDAVIKREQGWETTKRQYKVSTKDVESVTSVVRVK